MGTMSAQNSEGTGQEATHVVGTVGQTISATLGTRLEETLRAEQNQISQTTKRFL